MVAEVVAYCEANKISNKQRLKELGVSAWSNLKIRKTSRLLSEAYVVIINSILPPVTSFRYSQMLMVGVLRNLQQEGIFL